MNKVLLENIITAKKKNIKRKAFREQRVISYLFKRFPVKSYIYIYILYAFPLKKQGRIVICFIFYDDDINSDMKTDLYFKSIVNYKLHSQ